VHRFPSLHGLLLFVLTHPVDVLHESVVQRFPSSQSRVPVEPQEPPLHTSPVVQTLPSVHESVLFDVTQPDAGEQ